MRKKNFKRKLLIAALIIVIAAFLLYFYFAASQQPSVKIYFIKDGKLAPVSRTLAASQDAIALAVNDLLRGPNSHEQKAGYFSEIPEGAKILEISQDGAVLNIKFSPELEKYGGGSARVFGLIGQIVYTFTEIKGIEKIRILIDNKNEVVLGSEGFVIDKPLSRQDLEPR